MIGKENCTLAWLLMGLQQQNMWHFHACLRSQCHQQVLTWHAKSSTTQTFHICNAYLWLQNPVCNARWNTSSHGKIVSQHSKSHRIHLWLCKSSGPNCHDAPQWYCHWDNKSHWKKQAKTNQLLDYLETHPDTTIICYASVMILHIHSDASYL
jgi:hypothetical protein